MDEKLLTSLRDYGALGFLVVMLIGAVVKLWGEVRQVREDSDARAKRNLDQIETLVGKTGEAQQKLAETFATATVRHAEIFAATVREVNQGQRELTTKLLDLAEKD